MGAGAYVCIEESALIESIEGNRESAQTTVPTSYWFVAKPTIVNNVETFT